MVVKPLAGGAGAGGFVTAGFQRGALIVEHSDGSLLRLSWEGAGAKGVSPVFIRPGKYTIRGYRVLADDAQGVPWILSSSGHGLGTFDVQLYKSTSVPIDDTVRLVKRWQRTTVSATVLGQGHAGLSIYRDGKRIPLKFRLRDADGAVAQEGTLEYG